MTAKHRRFHARLFAPRPQLADNRYGLHVLDSTAEEVIPGGIAETEHSYNRWAGFKGLPTHRNATEDDPWLSPEKAEALQAIALFTVTIGASRFIAGIQTPPEASVLDNGDLDLRDFCEDVELTPRQTEVVCMVGEGWGVMAVADQLGISHQAVSKHLGKARHKLFEALPLELLPLVVGA